MNSYQKLKTKITELETDIYNIVKNSETEEGITTAIKYQLKYNIDEAMFVGDSKTELRGILSQTK